MNVFIYKNLIYFTIFIVQNKNLIKINLEIKKKKSNNTFKIIENKIFSYKINLFERWKNTIKNKRKTKEKKKKKARWISRVRERRVVGEKRLGWMAGAWACWGRGVG